MATVKIGGEDVVLPEMSVRVMRLVLPMVEELQQAVADRTDDVASVDRMVGLTMRVLATWLKPPPMFEPIAESGGEPTLLSAEKVKAHIDRETARLEDRMSAREVKAAGPAIQAALDEHGMEAVSGEAAAQGTKGLDEPPLSDSMTSSPNSSPAAAAV